MNRLVIESIEGRILAGITMFVAIMVLIGWVAINEPARMASFERQQLGRSIERGGELYAANCATCHGPNGYGQAGLVPALNNPQLFGHEFVGEVNGQIGRLQRQQQELQNQINDITEQRNLLITEASNADTSDERRQEIVTLIADIDAQLDVSNAESLPAQIATIDTELAPLLTQRDTQLDALQVAIDKGYLGGLNFDRVRADGGLALTEYIDNASDRLTQAGWGGDISAFLRTTLYHGRPGTADVWQGKQMVAWAQIGGGPMRTDQIDDLVNYIVNWDKGDDFTTDDLFAVDQFMKLKADAEMVGEPTGAPPIGAESGDDLDTAVTMVLALSGDPERGKAIYEGAQRTGTNARLACSSCHTGGAQAPATDAKWDTAQTVRLLEPQFAGWTVEKYLIDSILYPNDYVVPGYASGVMPATYPGSLTAQDLADILAYVKTYSTNP
jgi:mono/diheme cytochrome c family protein